MRQEKEPLMFPYGKFGIIKPCAGRFVHEAYQGLHRLGVQPCLRTTHMLYESGYILGLFRLAPYMDLWFPRTMFKGKSPGAPKFFTKDVSTATGFCPLHPACDSKSRSTIPAGAWCRIDKPHIIRQHRGPGIRMRQRSYKFQHTGLSVGQGLVCDRISDDDTARSRGSSIPFVL